MAKLESYPGEGKSFERQKNDLHKKNTKNEGRIIHRKAAKAAEIRSDRKSLLRCS